MFWVTQALKDLNEAKAESDLTKTQNSQVNNKQDNAINIIQFLCARMEIYAKKGQNVIYLFAVST